MISNESCDIHVTIMWPLENFLLLKARMCWGWHLGQVVVSQYPNYWTRGRKLEHSRMQIMETMATYKEVGWAVQRNSIHPEYLFSCISALSSIQCYYKVIAELRLEKNWKWICSVCTCETYGISYIWLL